MSLKSLDYPVKIIMAWAEAIAGNKKIGKWLANNGYPELYISVYAIQLKDDARNWLADNGYYHLLAMIKGVEGDQNALKWLDINKFEILYHLALAADGNEISKRKLKKQDKTFLYLALKIKEVKDIIQLDNDDVHRMSSE